MKKIKNVLKDASILGLFSTVCIIMTVFVYCFTKNKIIDHEKQAKMILFKNILSEKIFDTYQKKCYVVKNKLLGDDQIHDLWLFSDHNKAIAAVIESVAPDGYSGPIHLLIAAYLDGKIIGVRVISHKETPGIGDKIELSISDWITRFKNMHVFNIQDNNVLLKKYGGSVEQFTGATITPQAVTTAIKNTVLFIHNIVPTSLIKDCI